MPGSQKSEMTREVQRCRIQAGEIWAVYLCCLKGGLVQGGQR